MEKLNIINFIVKAVHTSLYDSISIFQKKKPMSKFVIEKSISRVSSSFFYYTFCNFMGNCHCLARGSENKYFFELNFEKLFHTLDAQNHLLKLYNEIILKIETIRSGSTHDGSTRSGFLNCQMTVIGD